MEVTLQFGNAVLTIKPKTQGDGHAKRLTFTVTELPMGSQPSQRIEFDATMKDVEQITRALDIFT